MITGWMTPRKRVIECDAWDDFDEWDQCYFQMLAWHDKREILHQWFMYKLEESLEKISFDKTSK